MTHQSLKEMGHLHLCVHVKTESQGEVQEQCKMQYKHRDTHDVTFTFVVVLSLVRMSYSFVPVKECGRQHLYDTLFLHILYALKVQNCCFIDRHVILLYIFPSRWAFLRGQIHMVQPWRRLTSNPRHPLKLRSKMALRLQLFQRTGIIVTLPNK